MKLWKSVVGKLWLTILFLVLIVLSILTVLLLEFIENYHVEEAKSDLTQMANKVAVILESHDDQSLARSITSELADKLTSIAIIQEDGLEWYSSEKDGKLPAITKKQIEADSDLNQALKDRKKLVNVQNQMQAIIKMNELSLVFHLRQTEKRHGLSFSIITRCRANNKAYDPLYLPSSRYCHCFNHYIRVLLINACHLSS